MTNGANPLWDVATGYWKLTLADAKVQPVRMLLRNYDIVSRVLYR